MQFSLKGKVKLKEVQILALGFLIVIFIGALILVLPVSSNSGEITNFLDAVFTSTSAVCVTGLTTMDTSTYWSAFGQTVIMILIEIGGLKTVTFSVLVLTVFSVIRGKEDVEVFGRRISKEIVYKCFTILFIEISLIVIGTMILLYTETNVRFINLLYEVT